MTAIEDARAALTREIAALVYGDNNFPDRDLSLATKIADLAIDRLIDLPTDDEREALRKAADRMSPLSEKPYTSLDLALVRDAAYRVVDGTFRRQGPITDAQVKRAHAAWDAFPDFDPHGEGYAWEHEEARIRAALEAARDA